MNWLKNKRNLEVEIELDCFSRRGRGFYKNGHKAIRSMEWMVFERYFEIT